MWIGIALCMLGCQGFHYKTNPDVYPFNNPWYYKTNEARNFKYRSNRTKEMADKLWQDTINEPFSMKRYVDILWDYRHCRMYTAEEKKSSIINIAVGRTGSGTLKQALIQNGLPGHHTTLCTALDAQWAGYQAVVVTIRDPVARILSGYQRREEGETSSKIENKMFMANFTGKGKDVNYYLDALRDRHNKMHLTAKQLTYGPSRQSYMIPLAEYYGLTHPELKIRVYYLCTSALSDDFEKLATLLGWPKPSAARDFYLSTQKRRLGSISSTKSEIAAQKVSEVNAKWIHEDVYKADSELYMRYCGPHKKEVNYHDGPSLV